MSKAGYTPEELLSELTYRSYRAQRLNSPFVPPVSWAAIFPDWEALEAKYQSERERYLEWAAKECDRWYVEGRVGL